MSDQFSAYGKSLTGPINGGFSVVPDDVADLQITPRAINVAGAGAVRVTTLSGDDITVYVAAGIPFPIRPRRVWATGTTATGIVGLY